MNIISVFIVETFRIIILLTSTTRSTDFMRETGKIHVVYGVITIVFIGIVLFLIYLNRRISQVEKKVLNDEIKQ